MRFEVWTRDDERHLKAMMAAVERNDLAGALLAVEGADDRTEARCRAQLALWGHLVKDKMTGSDAFGGLRALRAVLYDSLGFVGDWNPERNPRHSNLSVVVDVRRGLPILLSSIWSLVGHEAGLMVEGVGLPFHFVARIGGAEGLLFDPTEGGRILSEQDCQDIVERISQCTLSWSESFLDPVDCRSILERVLKNQMNAVMGSGDVFTLYRSLRFVGALRPTQAHYLLALARLTESLISSEAATRLYCDVLNRFDGSPEALTAGQQLSALSARDHVAN